MKLKSLFATVLCLLTITVQSQINQPGWMNSISGLTGNKSLSCSDNDCYVAIYNRCNINTPTHRFIVKEMTTGNIMAFSLSNITGSKYYINDMSLCDSVCYFCGMHVTYQHTGLGYFSSVDSSKVGFIGYFHVADVLAGSGRYYIEDVAGTDELTRICATRLAGRQLFCIGHPMASVLDVDRHPAQTCLVDFDFQSASTTYDSWKYSIFHAIHDGEVLMDVSDAGDGILVVSAFGGSNYKIGIRYSKYGPLSASQNHDAINVLNVFDTYPMLVDTKGVNVTWRDIKDRLFIHGHTVAHVSHNPTTGDHGVSFYRFDDLNFFFDGTITMSAAHYHRANDGVKLIDLKDHHYWNRNTFNDNTSALLDDTRNNQSIILKEKWNVSGTYPTTELKSDWSTLKLRSICPYEQQDHLFSVGYRTEDRGLIIEGHDSDFLSNRLSILCLDDRFGMGYSVSPLVSSTFGNSLYQDLIYFGNLIEVHSVSFTSAQVDETSYCIRTILE